MSIIFEQVVDVVRHVELDRPFFAISLDLDMYTRDNPRIDALCDFEVA